MSEKAKPATIDLTEEVEPVVEPPTESIVTEMAIEEEPQKERVRCAGSSLIELRKAFLSRLRGQDVTLNKLSNILYDFNANCQQPREGKKMILPLLLSGTSGTGKTSTVEILLEQYGLTNKSENFLYQDMSEITAKTDLSKLLGSPPSYLGYGEKNFIDRLFLAIGEKGFNAIKKPTAPRARAGTSGRGRGKGGATRIAITPNKSAPPSMIVLHFEEVDKAHESALTILINFLETGRLTSGNRREFVLPDETRMIVVCTANFGKEEISEMNHLTDFFKARTAVTNAMEFAGVEKPMIGRFPHILPYFPFSSKVAEQITSESIAVLFELVEFQYRDYFSRFSIKKESEVLVKKTFTVYAKHADPELGMRGMVAICQDLKRELCCESMFFLIDHMPQEKLPLSENPVINVLQFMPVDMCYDEFLLVRDRCEANTTTYHLLDDAWEKKLALLLLLVEYKGKIMTSVVVRAKPTLNLALASVEAHKNCDGCGHFSPHYNRVRCPEIIGCKIRMIFKSYCNLCIYNNSLVQQPHTRPTQLQIQSAVL